MADVQGDGPWKRCLEGDGAALASGVHDLGKEQRRRVCDAGMAFFDPQA